MFTDAELKQALEQMLNAQKEDRSYGQLAAEYVNTFIKVGHAGSEDNVSPYGLPYQLSDIAHQRIVIELSPYQDWHGTLKILEQHGVKFKIPISQWNGRYSVVPKGSLDLTGDSMFVKSRQKTFDVLIKYFDPGFYQEGQNGDISEEKEAGKET